MPNDRWQDALYLQSGSPETEHRVADGYSGGQLGSVIIVKDKADASKAKGYQLVQNDSAMDVLPYAGAVAWWRNATGYVVTTDVSVAGRGNVAGSFRCVSAVNEIVCVQQKGPGTVDFSAGTPSAAGLIVIPTATDATAEALAAGTAATYPPIGVTVGVVSGSLAVVEHNIDPRP